MRGNLAVRINDGRFDRHVTARVKGLRFTKAANGGHMFAEMRVIVPHYTFTDLGPADKVYVYDARTGRTVWEGFVENPGLTDGPAGQEFAIRAQGTVTLASDQSQPLFYVDRDREGWELHYQRLAQMTAGQASRPDADSDDGLLFQFPRGIAVDTGYSVSMRYERLTRGGLLLGGFRYYVVSGLTDSNYRTQALTEDGTLVRDRSATTAGTTVLASSAGSAFAVGQQAPQIRWYRNAGGATNVANDNTWTHVSDVWVRMLLHDLDGTQISGPGTYDDGFVYAHQVAADLVGRILTLCDPLASTVETATTAEIDQLAYPEGARPQEVLEELARFEPDMLWEILHSTDRGYVFNYRAWPTTPRYEISVKDGYEASGGDNDLCNRIAVYWTDESGNRQTTIVTADVPELGGDPADVGFSGRIRDAEPVTLPEGRGSAANAQLIGEQTLALKADPPRAARATVARPVMDRLIGSAVMPWEIEPGYLVRVRETGEDLRLTEMSYDDDSAVAELTLGTPARSFEELLAGLD